MFLKNEKLEFQIGTLSYCIWKQMALKSSTLVNQALQNQNINNSNWTVASGQILLVRIIYSGNWNTFINFFQDWQRFLKYHVKCLQFLPFFQKCFWEMEDKNVKVKWLNSEEKVFQLLVRKCIREICVNFVFSFAGKSKTFTLQMHMQKAKENCFKITTFI